MAQRKIIVDHDFETFCELDVRKVGAYKYAQHPSCEPLVLTWGTNPDDLRTWIPHRDGDALPDDLLELCNDDNVVFQAHNAQFEFCIWRYVLTRAKYGAPKLPFRKFQCTAVRAAAAGLPRSLDGVGHALGLDIQKDKEGSRLLRKFAMLQPARKPSKKNPDGIPARRILPTDEPKEFKALVKYNKTDVLVEMQVAEHTPPLSREEQRHYTLDLKMNTRGLPLDMVAVRKAMPVLTELERRNVAKVMKITGGIRPTQRDRMLEFCQSIELPVTDLKAKTLKDLLLLQGGTLTKRQVDLLRLRIEGGKASTKKLKKMLEVVCDDGRVRGGFLFYGAHTGRYAGRLIQPQNFTRGEYTPEQLERLFEAILLGDADALELLYAWPIDAIAQGMRGFIHAADGRVFYVSDFSAIEARLLAWLAKEEGVLEVYRKNGDVYIRMASKLYKIPEAEMLRMCKEVEDPGYLLKRKFAKDVVLGCGYQLGGPGFYRNCIERGIAVTEEECADAVKVYRKEHPNIVKFWYDVEDVAVRAVHQRATAENPLRLRNLAFFVDEVKGFEWFCIRLPSGRLIRYPQPKVNKVERFGKLKAQLSYRTEYKGKWIRETTYGGKLVENIVQAVAYDVMMAAMVRADEAGFYIVGTVHDEIVAENEPYFSDVKGLDDILRVRPQWCHDAPINAEGFISPRYRK